jgi:hypothetical protein
VEFICFHSVNKIELAITLTKRFKDYSAAQALLDEINNKKPPQMEKLFALIQC